MKKLYVNPSLEVLDIEVSEMLLVSGVFGEVDNNEVIEDWPW